MVPFIRCLLLLIIVAVRASAATGRLPYTEINEKESQTKEMAARHEQWMSEHGRTYRDAAEKELRLKIFKQNVEYIESFNGAAGGHKYKLGLNKFSDLTNEEFKATYSSGYMPPPTRSTSSVIIGAKTTAAASNAADVPDSWDWRAQGAVTPIKDQGTCGCCWAFSAVAAIEGLNQIKTGNLISLSEQQIVDCDVNGNDNGCNGGLPDGAFQYVKTNGGPVTEQSYPYTGTQCNSDASSVAVTISGYQDVPSNNEESALLQAVAQQPISVGIDGGDPNFQSYKTGVFTGPCGNDLDHAVTLVGYGVDVDGTKYWLVKNQWGTTWGEDGYMRILRDTDDPQGLCGIAMQPSYPIA